jgi:hypothetical protein
MEPGANLSVTFFNGEQVLERYNRPAQESTPRFGQAMCVARIWVG